MFCSTYVYFYFFLRQFNLWEELNNAVHVPFQLFLEQSQETAMEKYVYIKSGHGTCGFPVLFASKW